MTDKEIRIISRKRYELVKKVNPISLIKFIATKEVSAEDLEDKESLRSQIESVESIEQMQMLDEIMKEMGYDWNSSEKLYTENSEKSKSCASSWDEGSVKKEESKEDEDDSEDNDENCEECEISDVCPIRKSKEDRESTKFSDEKAASLKDNPDLTIYVKNGTLSIRGHVKAKTFLSVICELLNIISSGDKGSIKEFVDMWNCGTEDKKLHLAIKKEMD